MISVLSRRLPLNGNKPLFFLVFLMMVLPSCDLFKKQPREVTKKPPEKEKKDLPYFKIDTIKTEAEKAAIEDSIAFFYPITEKDTYDIAMLLPLFLNEENLSGRNRRIASIAYHYFEGFKMGLDTVKSCGTNFRLHVFDSENKASTYDSIFQQMERDGLPIDLMVGPFFSRNVKKVADFAYEKKINLLTPFVFDDSAFLKNPYYFSGANDMTKIGQKAALYAEEQEWLPKFFTFTTRAEMDSILVDTFVNTLQYNRIADSFSANFRLFETDWNNRKLLDTLYDDSLNVLFVPSDDEVFVSSFISGLKQRKKGTKEEQKRLKKQDKPLEDLDIVVFGLESWLDFGFLDLKTIKRYNIHFFTQEYIDYQSLEVNNFVDGFRNELKIEPDNYAFKAYDHAVLMGRLMHLHGRYFQRFEVEQGDWEGIVTPYQFYTSKTFSGWRLRSCRVIHKDDLAPLELK